MSFRVRLVEAGDEEQVTGALSEGIYNGNDYLPFTFATWLAQSPIDTTTNTTSTCTTSDNTTTSSTCTTPNNTTEVLKTTEKNAPRDSGTFEMYVAEDCHACPGVLAGLEVLSLLDARKTAMFRALRTRQEYRGQGVAKQLKKVLELRVCAIEDVQRIRIVTLSISAQTLHLYRDMDVVEETGILGIWIARNQAQVLQLPLWSNISSFYRETPPFIERVDARTLWAAIESSTHHPVPRILLHYWIALDCCLDSLLYLERDGVQMYLERGPGSSILSVAFYLETPEVKGVAGSVTIYASSKASLFAHLSAVHAKAQPHWNRILCYFSHHLALDADVKNVVMQLAPFMHFEPGTTCAVLELPIERLRMQLQADMMQDS